MQKYVARDIEHNLVLCVGYLMQVAKKAEDAQSAAVLAECGEYSRLLLRILESFCHNFGKNAPNDAGAEKRAIALESVQQFFPVNNFGKGVSGEKNAR